ncbi:hypothetical protein, partial [Microbacterium sp.]|uniref:hypothetical protein n=1 Tax=Microbacterium sp. TaxID=51671 RepID=UPI0039E37365
NREAPAHPSRSLFNEAPRCRAALIVQHNVGDRRFVGCRGAEASDILQISDETQRLRQGWGLDPPGILRTSRDSPKYVSDDVGASGRLRGAGRHDARIAPAYYALAGNAWKVAFAHRRRFRVGR